MFQSCNKAQAFEGIVTVETASAGTAIGGREQAQFTVIPNGAGADISLLRQFRDVVGSRN